MDTWGQGFLLIKDECEKMDAPLPEIKATDKHVTVTIHGCKKYMELLNSSSSANLVTSEGAGEVDSEGAGEGAAEVAEKVVLFCKTPKTKNEIQNYLGIKSDRYVRQEIIQPLLSAGKLVRTIPEKPSSPKQKYIAT